MKRTLFPVYATVLLLGILIFVVAVFGQDASQQIQKAGMPTPLVGTWKLVSRRLPNGSLMAPPMIIGLQTYTTTMRNFNVGWADNAGKHSSYSVISEYTLSPKEYTETVIFSCLNDETGTMTGQPGTGPVYVMKSETKSSPVTVAGKQYGFQMPFDPPAVTISGNTMTATLEGKFTDTWERIR